LTAPIIVSALFGPEDHCWFDAQRKAHFPPDRNVLAAHLTLFHHIPPSVKAELCQRLKNACLKPPPRASITALMSLGRGVAYRVDCPGLECIREELVDAFAPLLMPQDKAGWRAHVTIQNKVESQAAKSLLTTLTATFHPRPLEIAGLAAWWYRDGPWEAIGAWRFGGGQSMRPPRMRPPR
jgi:2'-5' RNA ligase superfamily